VLDQQHVHLIPIRRRDHRLEDIVRLLRRRLRPDQFQPAGDAVDMRVDGEDRVFEREEQHAIRRLGPHAFERSQVVVGELFIHVREMLNVDRAAVGLDLLQDRLDARRLLVRQAADADVTFDFCHRRSGDLVP